MTKDRLLSDIETRVWMLTMDSTSIRWPGYVFTLAWYAAWIVLMSVTYNYSVRRDAEGVMRVVGATASTCPCTGR